MSQPIPERVQRNIDSIAELEQEFLRQRSTVACISDRIADVAASPFFIGGHLVWIAGWILLNTFSFFGVLRFDPYPFCFLALCISSEAALLSMFVLMSQQRQRRQADQWAHVGLQVGMLSEQETTKMLQMLQSICNHLGLKKVGQDRELKEMMQETPFVAVMQELEKALVANDMSPPKPADEEKQAA